MFLLDRPLPQLIHFCCNCIKRRDDDIDDTLRNLNSAFSNVNFEIESLVLKHPEIAFNRINSMLKQIIPIHELLEQEIFKYAEELNNSEKNVNLKKKKWNLHSVKNSELHIIWKGLSTLSYNLSNFISSLLVILEFNWSGFRNESRNSWIKESYWKGASILHNAPFSKLPAVDISDKLTSENSPPIFKESMYYDLFQYLHTEYSKYYTYNPPTKFSHLFHFFTEEEYMVNSRKEYKKFVKDVYEYELKDIIKKTQKFDTLIYSYLNRLTKTYFEKIKLR